MQSFTLEVWDEGRPITHNMPVTVVSGSNWAICMGKAARIAKKYTRRGVRKVTITLNRV